MSIDLFPATGNCWPILALVLIATVLHRREDHPYERLRELILAWRKRR